MTVVSSSWPGQLPEDLKHLRGESRGSVSPLLNRVQQPVTQRYLEIALEVLETTEDHSSARQQQEGVGGSHDRESLTLSIRNGQVSLAACMGGGHWECLPQTGTTARWSHRRWLPNLVLSMAYGMNRMNSSLWRRDQPD